MRCKFPQIKIWCVLHLFHHHILRLIEMEQHKKHKKKLGGAINGNVESMFAHKIKCNHVFALAFQYGDTPLHTSARYGHAGVTRILISAKCRVSDQNKVFTLSINCSWEGIPGHFYDLWFYVCRMATPRCTSPQQWGAGNSRESCSRRAAIRVSKIRYVVEALCVRARDSSKIREPIARTASSNAT